MLTVGLAPFVAGIFLLPNRNACLILRASTDRRPNRVNDRSANFMLTCRDKSRKRTVRYGRKAVRAKYRSKTQLRVFLFFDYLLCMCVLVPRASLFARYIGHHLRKTDVIKASNDA